MRNMRWFGWFVLLFVCLASLAACPETPAKKTEEVAREAVTQEKSAEVAPEEMGGSEPLVEPVADGRAENVSEKVVEVLLDGGGVEQEATPEPSPESLSESMSPDAGSHITLTANDPKDVVASYLLSGSAWNYFSGATVPLGRHFGTGNPSYHTAFRFTNVQVPQGATVTGAYLSFVPQNEVDSNNRLMINIYAEKVADSAAYDPMNYTQGRPDQRSKTTAKIDRWIVRCNADCSDDVTSPKYEYDCMQRKKDCWDRQTRYDVPKNLKDLLQEVFTQPSWKAGNALSVFLFNAATDQEGDKYKASRTITGVDAAQQSKSPQLVILFK